MFLVLRVYAYLVSIVEGVAGEVSFTAVRTFTQTSTARLTKCQTVCRILVYNLSKIKL